jgi:hypothetical protein
MALPRLAVVPLIFVTFPLLLWAQTGDPLGFMRAEQGWGRTLSPAGPLGGLWEGARAAFAGIEQLVHGPGRIYWTNPHVTDLSPDRVAAQNLEQLAYLLVFLVLTVVAWQRVGHAYGAFAGLSLAIPLSEPAVAWPLLSMPRFTLAAFPLFIALAKTGTSRRARMTIVTASTVLLVVTLARWSLGWWVA